MTLKHLSHQLQCHFSVSGRNRISYSNPPLGNWCGAGTGDVSMQLAATGKNFVSYPAFSFLVGGVFIAVGGLLIRCHCLSPQICCRVRAYIRENWGAPFIVGFMFLLIVAAVSLSIGELSFADSVAVYAFYALGAGVILQLACFLSYGRKSAEATV